MAFKSRAQRERCRELLRLGEITQEAYDRWEAGTPSDIPDKVAQKTYIIRKHRQPRGTA